MGSDPQPMGDTSLQHQEAQGRHAQAAHQPSGPVSQRLMLMGLVSDSQEVLAGLAMPGGLGDWPLSVGLSLEYVEYRFLGPDPKDSDSQVWPGAWEPTF